MPAQYDPQALAWAAGFFDGEGNVRFDKHGLTPKIAIGQVDRRVLDRFKDSVQIGRITGPYQYKRSHLAKTDPKPVWTYVVTNHREVQQVMCVLWKYLSPIKKEQFVSTMKQSLAVPAMPQRRNRAAAEKLYAS